MDEIQNQKTLIIFKKEKNPMQSSESHDEFIGFITDKTENNDWEDPNMGWTSSSNMLKQIHLKFGNLEDAKDFAKKYGYDFALRETQNITKNVKKKSYFNNFRKKNS
jgi:hypothetical protein